MIHPPKATYETYAHGSKIAIAALVVGLSIVPDAVLFAFVIPRYLWFVDVGLDALNIYACVWLFGIYGTMVRRPHSIAAGNVILNDGIMSTLEFDPQLVLSVRQIGLVKRHKLRERAADRVCVLGFGGVPVVEIVLTQDVSHRHLYAFLDRAVRKIYVPSDAAAEFVAALRQTEGTASRR